MDPENGKIYRAKVKLEDGGKTLHVPGLRDFFTRAHASMGERGMSIKTTANSRHTDDDVLLLRVASSSQGAAGMKNGKARVSDKPAMS